MRRFARFFGVVGIVPVVAAGAIVAGTVGIGCSQKPVVITPQPYGEGSDVPPPDEPAAGPKRHGVYVDDIDRKVEPCTSFYDYANGNWRAKNPIPPTTSKWSRRWKAGEENKDRVKDLLEATAAKTDWPANSPEQIVGDFYRACMDESKVESRGVAVLDKPLADIEGIKKTADVQAAFESLHKFGMRAPFTFGSAADNHDPSRTIGEISRAKLGLPTRDYYVSTDKRFVEARAKYHDYVAAMFEAVGKKGGPAADAVMELETALAKAALDEAATRDPASTDHLTTQVQLAKLAPHINWKHYFDALKVGMADVNVAEPKQLAEVDRQLATAKIATWRAYLAWQVIQNAAFALPKAVVDESFKFTGAYLEGQQEMKPRWKRCAEGVDLLFGDAIGKKYVEKYFSPEAKKRVSEMITNILAAMGDTIQGATWMGDETKKHALAKLKTFYAKVGYPDTWKDYDGVTIKPDAMFEDMMQGKRWNTVDDLSLIGKPTDKTRWWMTVPTSDASYDPLTNAITFPAGILQPPVFDIDATDAINYGAIGAIIGHEVSHGFDDQGAQYDFDGKLHNWWTKEDLEAFQKRGQCVVDQFDSYEVEPGIHENGKLVLGESIGDLGGMKIAWLALHKSLAGKPTPPVIDGFDVAKQFFLSWGQYRGDATRPELARKMVQNDPHPIAKYRVMGPISNLPEFAKTFGCKPDAPMVRPEGKRCEVW